ncbi:hypothetical protein ENSA5_27970 [Enhygromyxa salina]|uniref:Uncharacterized protein n=1 Tax=Enhygromyxa salina TaxID=215803 RepID=A0A2S9Y4E8_9BACT|nr:hypothetical protein ENSA5_27970 [Enhygromyxa salina]
MSFGVVEFQAQVQSRHRRAPICELPEQALEHGLDAKQQPRDVGLGRIDLHALTDRVDELAGLHRRPVAVAAALMQALGFDAEAHAQLGPGQGHELAEGPHPEAGEVVAQARGDSEAIEGHGGGHSGLAASIGDDPRARAIAAGTLTPGDRVTAKAMKADDDRGREAGRAQGLLHRHGPRAEIPPQQDHARGVDPERVGLRELAGLDPRREVEQHGEQLGHGSLDALGRDDRRPQLRCEAARGREAHAGQHPRPSGVLVDPQQLGLGAVSFDDRDGVLAPVGVIEQQQLQW